MRKSTLAIVSLLALGLAVLAGCGGTKGSSSSSSTGGEGTTANASACTPSGMETHTAGTLTIATDKPAYPPYFENDEPQNGEGFESAVGYAIGKQLGYSKGDIKWTVEPFDSSYAPGPKNFDFDLNEISITPARSKVVSFSSPYYTNPQAILVYKGSPYSHARSLAAFKKAKIGVQVGTTSLTAVTQRIKPSNQPSVYNTSSDVVEALKVHQVDAIVVDYATALYLNSAVITKSTIAGQFAAPGGDNWGLLLKKGSALTPCVNKAMAKLKANGTLTKLTKQWMSSKVAVPVLK